MSSKVIVAILLIISFLNKSSFQNKKHLPSLSEKKEEVIQEFSLEERIKNFILKKNTQIPEEEAKKISLFIVKYSEEAKVDAKLLTSLICRESRFNSEIISPSGAAGLGQLMPSTAKSLGVRNVLNPEENIRATAYYLRKMLDKYEKRENQLELALLSYKLGENMVKNFGISELLKNPHNLEYIETIKKYYQEI